MTCWDSLEVGSLRTTYPPPDALGADEEAVPCGYSPVTSMANTPPNPDRKLERIGAALDRVDELLFRVAEHGLERVTTATLRDFQAVSQTAHHARLPLIERELEAMTSQLRRYLDRDPSFVPWGFVSSANRVWMRVAQTRLALPAAATVLDLEPITGVPRRRYDDVRGERDVVCVGAAGWVTDSGYVGVTAHLFDRTDQRFVEAAMVRPDRMFGPVPSRLLRQPLHDDALLTMQEFCHGAWTLSGVRRSDDGRLSLHRHLQVSPAPHPGRASLDPLSVPDAAAILDRLASRAQDPIGGLGELLVLVEPVSVGRVALDDTHARASVRIRDVHGAGFRVSMPLRPQHDILLDNLKLLGTAEWSPDGLVGMASVSRGSLRFRPMTAVYERPVSLGRRIASTHLVHLTVEPLERARR